MHYSSVDILQSCFICYTSTTQPCEIIDKYILVHRSVLTIVFRVFIAKKIASIVFIKLHKN